jgi:D-sedoheptulose 7-phosphate isomerase
MVFKDAQYDRDALSADGDYIGDWFRRSIVALDAAARDPQLSRTVAEIAGAVSRTFSGGGKLLIAGNGGSAADAQHLAAEFLSRFASERQPLPAIALTTDTSVLTAIGNDYGFEHIFERQVRGLARPGDVFLAISTSGRSPNVIAALQTARAIGATTIGFTGQDGAQMRDLCDLCLQAPSSETAVIQQVHIVVGHIVCGLAERTIAAS